jgi:large conductance mechanosensitive channel
MLKDFKAFAMRGNVVDLAIGVIIGAAFGKIVASFVEDMLMPLLSPLLGKADIKSRFIDLSGVHHATIAEAKAAGAATINYGIFLNTVVDFLIVALVIFLALRWLMRLRPPVPPAAAPKTRECPRCLSVIPERASRCAFCTSELGAPMALV